MIAGSDVRRNDVHGFNSDLHPWRHEAWEIVRVGEEAEDAF